MPKASPPPRKASERRPDFDIEAFLRRQMPATVLVIEKGAMFALLHDEPTFSDRFIAYMLARNLRIEADLVDHLFNSSRSASREPFCCWRGTAIRLVRSGGYRESRRKRSLK